MQDSGAMRPVGAKPCFAPTEDGDLALRTSHVEPPALDFGHRTSDIGQRTADSHTEPAAWVFARDRDGYSELCWLAAWRASASGAEHSWQYSTSMLLADAQM